MDMCSGRVRFRDQASGAGQSLNRGNARPKSSSIASSTAAVDDVGQQPRSLGQLDDGDVIGNPLRQMRRIGLVVHHPGHDAAMARTVAPFVILRKAGGAIGARRQPVMAAGAAMLAHQPALGQRRPVRPGGVVDPHFRDIGFGHAHPALPNIMVAWVCMLPP
jgi:hypothetical protein